MKLQEKKIKNLIKNNPLAIATISGKKPYVIGVSCCKVLDDKIVITDEEEYREYKKE